VPNDVAFSPPPKTTMTTFSTQHLFINQFVYKSYFKEQQAMKKQTQKLYD
jgi:hypothetical protein